MCAKNDLHDICKRKALEIRILKFDCLRERKSSIEESGSRFQISVVTGSGIRELLDKSKNMGEGGTVLFWDVVFFCFSMKWGPQGVATVGKSGKSVRKKESESELSKRGGPDCWKRIGIPAGTQMGSSEKLNGISWLQGFQKKSISLGLN